MTARHLKLLWLAPMSLLFCGMGLEKIKTGASIGQPSEERSAQDKLPHAAGPVWSKFLASKVRYDNRNGIYSIAVSPEVKQMAGKPITLSGFVLPLDASDHTSHFLLTRNTPVCLFCPPGQPNEVVEVTSPRPILWTDKMVTVTGPLSLINNGEKGMFFKIADATVR